MAPLSPDVLRCDHLKESVSLEGDCRQLPGQTPQHAPECVAMASCVEAKTGLTSLLMIL